MLPCSMGILCMNKMSQYFNTLEITRGFLIALLGSGFIYLDYWGWSHPFFNTLLALASLFLLLLSDKKTWLWYGVFTGILWFWWITLSLEHYGYSWALPIGIFFIALVYGFIFWFIAYIAEKFNPVFTLLLKSLALLSLSYLHPFDFDWLKPELMFVESYLGIQKWQFGIVLLSLSLSIWKKNILFLGLVILAYSPTHHTTTLKERNIQLVSTYTSVKDKWNKSLHQSQFDAIFKTMDEAIANKKSLIILPESVFPVFINRSQSLMDALQERAKKISIITGGLYWDGKTPRNSTYIFTDGKITVANKVVLVPFGESNPLPDFLSDWVNKVFYDGAVDYKASPNVIDYKVNGETYRNAICFEATSEKLYKGKPQKMIVLSNDGWFVPSIEPTLQKLLLQYYSKKYGTTIYHAVNMSESYVIKNGQVIFK